MAFLMHSLLSSKAQLPIFVHVSLSLIDVLHPFTHLYTTLYEVKL